VHGHVVPPLAARGRLALTRPELERWGFDFGASARPPLCVAIRGDLGAGKTTLVRAICRGYGVEADVTSPTFALVHEYASPRSVTYHLDLYRLERESDLVNIGWYDIIARHALILVEWPERAGGMLPADHVSIELEHIPGDPERRLLLAG
jgi:tRNA threonylcarbamoyladenosine biosynthesis protein TsaE